MNRRPLIPALTAAALFSLLTLAAAEEPPAPPAEAEQMLTCCKKFWPGLQLDGKLCEQAQQWADHLAETGKFCHGKNCRENIARGYATPAETAKAWRLSRGHAANFRRSIFAGFGCARYANGRRVWVARLK